MKKTTVQVAGLGLAAALLSSASLADCAYPKPPNDKIPDGNSAQREQLIEARKAVQEYVAAVDTYVACITEELNTSLAKGGLTDEQKVSMKQMVLQKNDAAQAEKETIGAKMNDQLRAFNARTKPKS